MPVPMTQDSLRKLTNLEVALRAVFLDQMIVPDPLEALYNPETSSRAIERNLGVGGFGDVPEYKGAIDYDSFETLYTASYQHTQYAQGFAVTREMIDDDEYGQMAQLATRLGIAFARTQAKQRASVFNNAFSASYTGPDSVALCSASHPYSPTDATTQSNTGTTALSHDAVIATRKLMMRFKDSKGNELGVMPDTIVVPIELIPTAEVIIQSLQKSGTADNDANVNAGYNVVSSHWLTDSNNWFLVDSAMARMYLNWFTRVAPEFMMDPSSDFDLEAKFRGYMRHSYGWDRWEWIYGHSVT